MAYAKKILLNLWVLRENTARSGLCYILSTSAKVSINFAKCWPIFAGIPPELRVVSKLVKIKCDLIFYCEICLIVVVNYLIDEC